MCALVSSHPLGWVDATTSPECRASGKLCWRMWLRPETGERSFCVPEDLHTVCGSKESRVRAQKQGPSYQLAVKSTGQPHVLSQGEQGWRAFGPHPASPGGQGVRRWEAERLFGPENPPHQHKGSTLKL